MGAIMTGCSP